jgi:hypothetical protein
VKNSPRSSLVIAELVWTLESFYGLTREAVKVLAILNTPGLEVADGDRVLQAIVWHADHLRRPLGIVGDQPLSVDRRGHVCYT